MTLVEEFYTNAREWFLAELVRERDPKVREALERAAVDCSTRIVELRVCRERQRVAS